MGALTDHGPTKLHGWQKDDYDEIFNHGRGPFLFEFRNYMLQNIGIPTESPLVNKDAKFRITFATNSSRFRVTDFQTHDNSPRSVGWYKGHTARLKKARDRRP